MNTTVAQLQSVRVADVMNREVITISANSEMSVASRALLEHGVSGAPVVDERGKCVGVLSLTDFARRDRAPGAEGSMSSVADEFVVERDPSSGAIHIEHEVEGYVRQHMTDAVQCIDSEQTLIEAARYMHAEQIHRLIVLDHASCPVGVITTLDILAVLVEHAQE